MTISNSEQVKEQLKQYEEAMKDPRIQEQSQQLQQVMQSPEMMRKMAELKVSLTGEK